MAKMAPPPSKCWPAIVTNNSTKSTGKKQKKRFSL